MTFKKAELTELNAQNQTVGEAVAVQFNPATLRIQFSNRSASGGGAGAPARQRAGEGSTTVSFDLHFDTADEGSAGAPLSVLTKTSQVERFVRPRGTAPGQEAPPRVQFEWGGIKVQGVMESCSLDLELFADDGTPLRARCGVQIKGQDPSYALAPSGAGLGGLAAGLANAAGGLVPPALSPTQSGLPMPASPGSAPGSGVQAGALGETASRTAPAAGAAPDASAASAGTSADRLTPKALTRAGGLVAAQSQARSTAHTAQARQRLAGFATTASGAAATGDDRPYGFGLPLKPRRGFVSADTPRPATRRLRCSCSGACGCKH